jgi:hypothetical protein
MASSAIQENPAKAPDLLLSHAKTAPRLPLRRAAV